MDSTMRQNWDNWRKQSSQNAEGVFLLKDNASVHIAQVTVAGAANYDFELLSYPLYSPDLAPSDFFLIPKLKQTSARSPF